jgi:hypothetical protein
MRNLLPAFVIFLASVLPLKANEAIESVIAAQIEAFLADDFDTAFSYASPMIQGMFQTPENFGVMVREGYPMVWRPSDVEFLSLETRQGALWQDVLVRDAGGALHILEYQMVEGDEGWRINAVRVRKPGDGMA